MIDSIYGFSTSAYSVLLLSWSFQVKSADLSSLVKQTPIPFASVPVLAFMSVYITSITLISLSGMPYIRRILIISPRRMISKAFLNSMTITVADRLLSLMPSNNHRGLKFDTLLFSLVLIRFGFVFGEVQLLVKYD